MMGWPTPSASLLMPRVNMKNCSYCGETKPITMFHRNKRSKDGRQQRCAACSKIYRLEYREKHPDRLRATNRKAYIKCVYGVSAEQYDTMLNEQGGVCYICRNACPTGRRLSIDHDHTTGAIRALLCRGCNVGLGHFKDNTDLLLKAVDYLKLHGTEQPTNNL